MKLMNEMSRAELIETVAVVSFRVLGVTSLLGALYSVVFTAVNCFSFAAQSHHPSPDSSYFTSLFISSGVELIVNLALAYAYFAFAVPLGRLASRGLARALEI
jgi:hypothetical protein